MGKAFEIIQYQAYEHGEANMIDAGVIAEHAVSLTVNGQVWLTFMCSPTDLAAQAVGFLFNEGIIEDQSEIADVYICKNEANVDVWLHKNVEEPKSWKRTSGCTGGYSSVEAEDMQAIPADSLRLEPQQVLSLIRQLFEAQELYRQSGGVHSSAISDGHKLVIRTDDVGRHNTLDKLAGHLLLDDLDIDPRVVVSTGRISSEMLQKSARLGASVVISRTSPTSQSVELAQRKGITLIGYARGHRFNIYSHPERIAFTKVADSVVA
ncbi:MAG: formate dehydrogenase accessory sulfurtransferase FdhD [Chloroflexi bacterium]|nr:MAG: formate dehydrogenase accessory sulfurtransferase FdhD [Chloroflexota bacterium]MBL1194134.1 formate dehydrogenase accessory sulfurtransferase FdhD [Chloroflexota bacterium]NOH11427.1 formate dehydrogenase accessory sulfurtransferase FdhD [Chloroflexota bacterium]